MPWPELRSEEWCCRLCSASSLQHLFEGGPATPETIPTIRRHFLLPHRPRRICSILGLLATKPQEEGKAAMSHLWETPRTFLRTRAGRHAGWGGTICSSITTWLLSVGEAPATIGLGCRGPLSACTTALGLSRFGGHAHFSVGLWPSESLRFSSLDPLAWFLPPLSLSLPITPKWPSQRCGGHGVLRIVAGSPKKATTV